jgi:hypothetical protein
MIYDNTIEELADQCWEGTPQVPDFDYQKFGEMLVRECIKRVRSQYIPTRDKANRTEYEQGVVECGIKSVISLEELIEEQAAKWHKENVLGDDE